MTTAKAKPIYVTTSWRGMRAYHPAGIPTYCSRRLPVSLAIAFDGTKYRKIGNNVQIALVQKRTPEDLKALMALQVEAKKLGATVVSPKGTDKVIWVKTTDAQRAVYDALVAQATEWLRQEAMFCTQKQITSRQKAITECGRLIEKEKQLITRRHAEIEKLTKQLANLRGEEHVVSVDGCNL